MNKLIYVYVDQFLNFEPVSLNLANDFHCEIKENILTVRTRQDLFREVLGPTVMDINVIAGENGVGKTQLLKLLAEITSGATTIDYIADYRYVLVYQTGQAKLSLSSNIEIEYPTKPLPGFTMSEQGEQVSPVIYYSPFLDFNPLEINTRSKRKPIIDISLSHIIMEDTQQSQKKMEIVPTILTLKANSILRQIDFVAHQPLEFDMPFTLPSGVYIRFNRLSLERDDVSINDRELFDKLTAFCPAFFRESKDNGISQSEMAKLMFLRNLLSLYFLSVNNDKSQTILHHSFDSELVSQVESYDGKEPVELIELLLKFFEFDDIFKNEIFQRLTRLAFSLIDSQEVSIHVGSSNNHLTLGIPSGDQRIQTILGEMNNPEEHLSNKYIVKELFHFISFDWRNFSSGEKSFLDLFARLYGAKKQLEDTSNTVLLLLDEAEVGFHPEWQKKFVSYLVGFLNAQFPGYTFQVVIATHSPLVLSDFPSERVHLFRRAGEQVVRAMNFGTFAQNIPELLAREFFIDTTLIGDLAKKYIDNILSVINNQDRSEVLNVYEGIIARIGKIDEPVIKQLLLDSLTQRLDVEN